MLLLPSLSFPPLSSIQSLSGCPIPFKPTTTILLVTSKLRRTTDIRTTRVSSTSTRGFEGWKRSLLLRLGASCFRGWERFSEGQDLTTRGPLLEGRSGRLVGFSSVSRLVSSSLSFFASPSVVRAAPRADAFTSPLLPHPFLQQLHENLLSFNLPLLLSSLSQRLLFGTTTSTPLSFSPHFPTSVETSLSRQLSFNISWTGRRRTLVERRGRRGKLRSWKRRKAEGGDLLVGTFPHPSSL